MTKDNCPCAPLYTKCKYNDENYADCAIHRLNFAVYSALAQATNGIIEPYHCPNFQIAETANKLATALIAFGDPQKNKRGQKMTERKFKDLIPGEKFVYGDVEFVALGEEQGGILAVAVEPLQVIPFDTDNKNDWRTSSLRKYLNGEYLEKIDTSGLMEYESDLTSDDGMVDYGTSKDLIFLLSADLYRKYRYRLPKWKTGVWLITPESCLEEYADLERLVFADSSLSGSGVSYGFGVAPACLFNPESTFIYEQLKPCPFCGGVAKTIVDDETESKFGVKCFNCGGAICAEKETLQDAVDAWNRRAQNDKRRSDTKT